jgi:hypothetical protein
MIDWAVIQNRMVNAGLDNVPNGRFVDSVRKGDFLYFIIEFNTPADEMWFKLKWL